MSEKILETILFIIYILACVIEVNHGKFAQQVNMLYLSLCSNLFSSPQHYKGSQALLRFPLTDMANFTALHPGRQYRHPLSH